MQIPSDQSAAIEKLVQAVSQQAYPFFTAVAAVGLLSMAIIQTVKDLFPVSRYFQWMRVRQWLSKRGGNLPSVQDIAMEDLVRLAADGDAQALYSLPLEQLCGQINSAAQIVMDNPKGHEELLRCLAASANTDDLQLLLEPPKVVRQARAMLDETGQAKYDSYVDARNRVSHQVQRAIDSLQISAGFRWKLYLHLASITLSAVIAGVGVFLFSDIQGTIRKLIMTLAVAVLSGFLAPVARDVVASLQQLRK